MGAVCAVPRDSSRPLSHFEGVSTTLQQIGLVEYLDGKSIKDLSIASSHCHDIVRPHISRYWTLTAHSQWCKISPSILPTLYQLKKIYINHSLYYGDCNCLESYATTLPLQYNYLSIRSYCLPIPHLPQHITHLTAKVTRYTMFDGLPPNLTHLSISSSCYDAMIEGGPVDHLPLSVTHVSLNFGQGKLYVDHLPPNITHLELGGYFDNNIDYLPPNITHLILGNYFRHNIDYLPPKLTYLKLGSHFNNNVDHLPITLKYLYIGEYFNQPL